MKKALIATLLALSMAMPAHACTDGLITDGDYHFASFPVSHFTQYIAEKRLEEEQTEKGINARETREKTRLTQYEKALCEQACDEEVCSCETPVEYLGKFTAHAYCGCDYCNGEWTGQPTASGTNYVEGRTVAVDPSVIPLGSKIAVEYADGSIQEFVAEDTGSGINGKMLDVYIADHQRAWDFGSKTVKVYLEVENEEVQN